MKLIAVSQRSDYDENHHESRDALDQRWLDFFLQCNLIPLLIPNSLIHVKNLITKVQLDGILLTGGKDSLERNNTEHFLLELAHQKKLPLFGVCHGMQFIQKFFGLTLNKISNHVCENQEIIVNGKCEMVNSYHDFGTTETNQELTVWARAHDGIVKAIKHVTLPIFGIMWHPERLTPFVQRDIKLVHHIFFEHCL